MNYYKELAKCTRIPPNWERIGEYPYRHPQNGEIGVLVRNKSTGLYALIVCGEENVMSCPQIWARENPEPVTGEFIEP